MNFILFNVILLFSGFITLVIFSFFLMALLVPMSLFAKSRNLPNVVIFPLLGIVGAYQIYFWSLWSAFCVAVTIRFTQTPEVTWDWLYWITGCMWCISLIGWLAYKETQSSQSTEEARRIEKGTTLYSLIAIVAFLFFAFFPSLIIPPYGWALKPLGLQSYITKKTTGIVEIDEKTHKSIEGFFTGYEYFTSANILARSMISSKDAPGDLEKVKTLLNKSKEILSDCDLRILNNIYNQWGDVLSNKLIPAIDLQLAGIKANGDRNDLIRGDALMADFDSWLQSNWSNLLLRLNEKFGYEIR